VTEQLEGPGYIAVESEGPPVKTHQAPASSDRNSPCIRPCWFDGEASDDYTQSFPATIIVTSDGVMDCPAILLSAELSSKIQTAVKGERERNKAQIQRNRRHEYMGSLLKTIHAKREELANKYDELSQNVAQLPLRKCFREMRAIDIRQDELSDAIESILAQDNREVIQMQDLNVEQLQRDIEVNLIMNKIFTNANLLETDQGCSDFDKTLPFDMRILDDTIEQDAEEPMTTTQEENIKESHTALVCANGDDDNNAEQLDPVRAALEEVESSRRQLRFAQDILFDHGRERRRAEAAFEEPCDDVDGTLSDVVRYYENAAQELERDVEAAERELKLAVRRGRALDLHLTKTEGRVMTRTTRALTDRSFLWLRQNSLQPG